MDEAMTSMDEDHLRMGCIICAGVDAKYTGRKM